MNLRPSDGGIQRAPARSCRRSFRTLKARHSVSAGMQKILNVKCLTTARVTHCCKLIQGWTEQRCYQLPDIFSAEAEESLQVQVLSPETTATAAHSMFFPQRSRLSGWWELRHHCRAWDRVHRQAALTSWQLQGGGATVSDKKSLRSGTKNIISRSCSEPISHSSRGHERQWWKTAELSPPQKYAHCFCFLWKKKGASVRVHSLQTADDNKVIKGKESLD